MVILLKDVPDSSEEYSQLMREWFGYEVTRVNGNICVSETDKALQRGPRDVLKVHNRIDLRSCSNQVAASRMVKAIPSHFDEYYGTSVGKLAEKITLSGNFGVLSRVEEIATKIVIANKADLLALVRDEVIPLMIKEFGATHITPVSVDAIEQQKYISFAKITLLNERFEPAEVDEILNHRNGLSGIEMSGGLDLLSLVNALTRFNPIYFSLPLHREGCVWHFSSDSGGVMNSQGSRSLFNLFNADIHPRYERASMFGRLPALQGDDIWNIIRLSVRGVNNLMRFANNPLTFLMLDGTIDWLRQIKARGLIYLILADLNSLVNAIGSHERIVISFALLDKIANLRVQFGANTRVEDKISVGALSLAQGKELKRIITKSYRDIGPLVAKEFIAEIGKIYGGLHRAISSQIRTGSRIEHERLNRLRAFRNLNHGTHLRSDQFEAIFLESSGSIPEEIVSIPWFLIHGLVAAPDRFVKFRPTK